MGKLHIVLLLHTKGQWFQEKALLRFGKNNYQILVVRVGCLADILEYKGSETLKENN